MRTFERNGEALAALSAKDIRIINGMIALPPRQLTAEETAAVEYLIDEWDYSLAGPYREE